MWVLRKMEKISWRDMKTNEEVLQISFIHSGHFYSVPFKSSTTQRRSRLQHGHCIGVSRRSAQAIAGKGLAQGPYMAARAGVEPTTLRLRVIASTNAPSCPNFIAYTMDFRLARLGHFHLIISPSIRPLVHPSI